MRGDWLSKKEKIDGGIIGQNFKKRDRVTFMKRGLGVGILHCAKYESQKKDSKNLHLEFL